MILTGSAIFISIGLPATIAYALVIISFLEKKRVYFQLRDACIATIALDVFQMMSIFELNQGTFKLNDITPMLIISPIMLMLHATAISLINRLPINTENHKKKITLTVFRDMYIGMLLLMTNAVSLAALIEMAGGIN